MKKTMKKILDRTKSLFFFHTQIIYILAKLFLIILMKRKIANALASIREAKAKAHEFMELYEKRNSER
jgi:hypothetical protein